MIYDFVFSSPAAYQLARSGIFTPQLSTSLSRPFIALVVGGNADVQAIQWICAS